MKRTTRSNSGERIRINNALYNNGGSRLDRYAMRAKLKKDIRDGNIDAKTAASRADELNVLYRQSQKQKNNNQTNFGQTVGVLAGAGAKALFDRWQRNNEHERGAGMRTQMLLDANARNMSLAMAPIYAQIQTMLMLPGGSGGTAYNGGAAPAPPPSAFSFFGPPAAGMPVPQASPSGIASPWGINPGFGMSTGGAGMGTGAPNTTARNNSLFNNNHFSPQRDTPPKDTETITLGNNFSFDGPEKIIKKLNDLQNKFGDAETLSVRQKYLDRTTQLLNNNATKFRSDAMYLEDFVGESMRDLALEFLQSGSAESDDDMKLEDLNYIGIRNHRDTEKFEKIITKDTINSYKKLLGQLGGDRSIGEAIKDIKKRNNGKLPENIQNTIIDTLGSNNDQEGLNKDQYELLDRFFKIRSDEIDVDEMSELLSGAVDGAASHTKNNHNLNEIEDAVRIDIQSNATGTVSGKILPTSKHASYIDSILESGSKNGSKSRQMGLRLHNVSRDDGLWSGQMEFTDSDGKTKYYELEEMNDNLAESFNDAFGEIYDTFNSEEREKGDQTAPGILKYSLGKLESLFKVNKLHSENIDSSNFAQNRRHQAHLDTLNDGTGNNS